MSSDLTRRLRAMGNKACDEAADRIEALESKLAAVTDVDWLAQTIRRVDGKHSLGAGALAEKIIEALREPLA